LIPSVDTAPEEVEAEPDDAVEDDALLDPPQALSPIAMALAESAAMLFFMLSIP
jgi:hypothetical protein